MNLVKKSEKILILTHQNPDGDAVGSALALLLALRKLKKNAVAAAADPVPQLLDFLPALENIETSIAGASDLVISLPLGSRSSAEVFHKIEEGILKIFIRPIGGAPFTADEAEFTVGEADVDLIVCVDVPDLPQLGKLFEANPNLFYEIPVVNIDHHASNTGFGQVNFVDTTAASSSELVLRLIHSLESEENKKLLDEDIATLILTGIITDTGSFQNSNTTPRSFEVSADLIEAGARQQEIIHHVYKTKQLTTLKLWGRVLSKIEFDSPHRIVWSTVSENDFREVGAVAAETEGLIDELMSNAPGAEVVLLLKQKGDLVSGSLRTTTPAVSASEIAGIFGGGGHLRAAGFKIPNSKVESSVEEILAKIRRFQAERLNLTVGTVGSNQSAVGSENKKVEKLYSKKKK
ncbi:DHH family phosphoesterase, partial [Patescibacteria group bacterium]|nr:DHH family phosphoesterase [Patescibacteria group bacterium]